MDLHGQIMNILADLKKVGTDDPGIAYLHGHRDARHAAAELALAADVERDELLALLRKARDEFKRMPRSLGYEFTHLPEIEAAIARR